MSKKTLYTKSLGRLVARSAATRNAGHFHIISGSTKWKVVREGNVRSSKIFESQQDAIQFAKKLARSHSGSVLIHTKAGELKEIISFAP